MRLRFSHILASICLVTLVGLIPENAEAGFVWITDSTAGSLMSAHDAGAGPANHAADRRIELGRPEPGFLGHSAGASAPSPQRPSTGSLSVAILSSAKLSGESQLIDRLGPDRKVWLPPAFLSGIFRPPRFVG